VADRVKSTHHEILFDWPDIIGRIKAAVYHAESPLKESYNTCSLALSELVRREGLKVILTGEGSDELFGGYVGYRFDMLQRHETDEPDTAETQIERQTRQKLWGDERFLYERNFYEFRQTKAAVYSEAVGQMLDDFSSEQLALVDVTKMSGRHPLHKRSYADFKLRLADHLLSDHGDRVSLANSVEARYPFLDKEVIEFAPNRPRQSSLERRSREIPRAKNCRPLSAARGGREGEIRLCSARQSLSFAAGCALDQ